MIRGLLFDKDGTLVDFNKTWGSWACAFLEEIAQGDARLVEALADAIGFEIATRSFHPRSAIIAGTPEEGVELMLPYLPAWNFDGLLAHSNRAAKDAPLAEVVPLAGYLSELRADGYSLGLATNDSEATARVHMASLGAQDRFDLILGSDSGFGGKPGPGMCLAFAEHVGLRPEAVAMVGDSTHDLLAGRAAGMTCVGVLTGVAGVEELVPHADVVLADIGKLASWLDQQAA
ncbi:MAG: HAD family hydrolase [Litoreibacter sp.]|nr:HAD family hydrolase [Litoreibacter sp.]